MGKKVLILANSSRGLCGFRIDLIRKLAESCQVAASTPFDGRTEELEAAGCRLIETGLERRGLNPLKDMKLLRAYKALLKKEKPDLVITYTIKPNIYGGLACRMRKIPYAVNITGLGTAFENPLLKRVACALYTIGLKKARVVFFENSENRDIFVREGIVKREKTCVLSGAGVNLEKYAYQPYPLDAEEIPFLFVGRVMREKGVDELLSAAERLHGEDPRVTLDVLGIYEETYEEKIRQCQQAGWLRYHGYQNDVRPFIGKAACFVLPSWHEGMANTNLECAASGRPVITSDIPGCREAVAGGVSGLLCRPKDAESLYQAMKKLAAMPPEQREQMGRAGRKRMEEIFDKRKVVAQTMDRLF